MGCLCVCASAAGGTPPREGVVFSDTFADLRHWDTAYHEGDKLFGKKRLSARTANGSLVLGTSACGATLRKTVPSDFIIDTQLKVSTIKPSPKTPEPHCPGANIFVRKTEQGGVWRSCVVRLWFRKAPTTGVVLIRGHACDLARGKYIKDVKLFEKRWRLDLDTWYDIRVAVEGNQITVWVDGEEIGTATDKGNLHPKGGIALSGYSWPSYAFFRNFSVLRPQ